jgi:hypothetical protein
MHQEPKGARDARAITTFDEDEQDQAAVLREVLELHPDMLTRSELTREMTGDGSEGFSSVDGVARAIRDLARSGLVHVVGEQGFVRPSRPAVRYFELTGGAG